MKKLFLILMAVMLTGISLNGIASGENADERGDEIILSLSDEADTADVATHSGNIELESMEVFTFLHNSPAPLLARDDERATPVHHNKSGDNSKCGLPVYWYNLLDSSHRREHAHIYVNC